MSRYGTWPAHSTESESHKQLMFWSARNMLWNLKADPRFSYRVEVPLPDGKQEKLGLAVVLHGTGGACEGLMTDIKPWADKHRLAVMAPLFPGGMNGPEDLNDWKYAVRGELRYDKIFLAMTEEMAERFPEVDTSRFFLFGHSAGGMFASRFLFAHPEKLRAVCISAPGQPVYWDEEEDFPWGIRNFRAYFGKDPDRSAIVKVPVQMQVGEKDCKPIDETPYGNNRTDRLRLLEENLREIGVQTEFHVLPGLGHLGGRKERLDLACRFFENVSF